jgi:FKBP-type peptidyl-prolyl cis-trans isomerase SlyD
MKIENRTVVTLGYTLTVNDNGKEVTVEETNRTKPFMFLFGNGQLLPEFEQNLAGKDVGDKFDFIIKAAQGYGLRDPQNQVKLPRDIFHDDKGELDHELIKPGVVVPLSDKEGNQYQAVVLEVKDDGVHVDFNHPLADKDLHFTGEVYDVRLATLEELQHGHAHGAGGHHH